LFHADARTDMVKLKVAFHDFANMPKKGQKFGKKKPSTVLYKRTVYRMVEVF